MTFKQAFFTFIIIIIIIIIIINNFFHLAHICCTSCSHAASAAAAAAHHRPRPPPPPRRYSFTPSSIIQYVPAHTKKKGHCVYYYPPYTQSMLNKTRQGPRRHQSYCLP